MCTEGLKLLRCRAEAHLFIYLFSCRVEAHLFIYVNILLTTMFTTTLQVLYCSQQKSTLRPH